MQTREAHELKAAVDAFHAANERAAAAPLGSEEYDAAMAELRRAQAECAALGIDPMASWRQDAQRQLSRLPLAHRPGERERASG